MFCVLFRLFSNFSSIDILVVSHLCLLEAKMPDTWPSKGHTSNKKYPQSKHIFSLNSTIFFCKKSIIN